MASVSTDKAKLYGLYPNAFERRYKESEMDIGGQELNYLAGLSLELAARDIAEVYSSNVVVR